MFCWSIYIISSWFQVSFSRLFSKMENIGKYWKILENIGKYWKIIENNARKETRSSCQKVKLVEIRQKMFDNWAT